MTRPEQGDSDAIPDGPPDIGHDSSAGSPSRGPVAEIRAFVTAALFQPVPRDHWQEPRAVLRRRVVSAVTLVIGAILLAVGLRFPPGDPRFYYATLALAAVWIVGAFASGPLHLGHAWTRRGHVGRPVVQSLALATLLVALFLAGAVVVARIPFLRGPVDELLDHARVGSLPLVAFVTLVNGIGAELYFRGALFAAAGRRHAVAITTVLYILLTVGSGVPLLVLAAGLLGLVTGMQRRVTGGVLGPILVHCAWSMSMLLLLPPLLDALR